MEETYPLVETKTRMLEVPKAPFARSLPDANPSKQKALIPQPQHVRRLPQAIAHRGYKTAFPENTMAAFGAAVAVGAHAIETDLHLSRDGVVVLSHDGTLKRCFGINKKIAECDWDYLSTLRTLREPKESMPRLSDLLEYLAQPGLEHMWILLDVKRDDDGDLLLRRVAETLAAAPTSKTRAWTDRVVFGCWNAKYVRLVLTHLPGFPIAHIGFSLSYARQFLAVPNISFNMLQKALVGPCGNRFLKDAQAADRAVFVWTVNEEEWMEWSIEKKVDGVITDDPKLFLEVCDRWSQVDSEGRYLQTTMVRRRSMVSWIVQYLEILGIQILIALFATVFLFKNGSPRSQVRKWLQEQVTHI